MVLVKLKNKAVSFFLTLLLLSCTANTDLVISGLDLRSSELIFDYQEDSAGDEEFFIRVFKLSKKELGLFSGRKKPMLNKSVFSPKYKVVDWENTPLIDSNKEGVVELLSTYQIKNSIAVEKMKMLISKLDKQNSMISYAYKSIDQYVYAVRLYLVDFEEGLFIECIVVT